VKFPKISMGSCVIPSTPVFLIMMVLRLYFMSTKTFQPYIWVLKIV